MCMDNGHEEEVTRRQEEKQGGQEREAKASAFRPQRKTATSNQPSLQQTGGAYSVRERRTNHSGPGSLQARH